MAMMEGNPHSCLLYRKSVESRDGYQSGSKQPHSKGHRHFKQLSEFSFNLRTLQINETRDYDAEAIVNQRTGGRKLGDAMKDDFLPAMEETGEIPQKFNEYIDTTGIIAPLMGRMSGARDNSDVAIAGVFLLGRFIPGYMAEVEKAVKRGYHRVYRGILNAQDQKFEVYEWIKGK